MNKKTFFELADVLTVLLVGAFLIKTGIQGKTKQVIDFFINNGLAFVKWLGAILALYGLGYAMPNTIKKTYWLFLTLILFLSKLGQELIRLTGK